MADWMNNDDGGASVFGKLSRATFPLTDAGYDPDQVRGDPQLRAQVMQQIGSPYGLQQAPAATGRTTPTAAPQTASATPAATPAVAKTPAATSANPAAPPSAQPSIDGIGREALEKGMALGGFAEQTARDLASSTGPDTSALEAERAKNATPTQLYDPQTGKMESQYAPSVGRRIWRGVEAGLEGLAKGGIRGALAGAVDPAAEGETPYGAPNKAYQATEAERQANLASEDQQIKEAQDKFKAMTDARKAASQEARAGVTSYADVGKTAKDLENVQVNQAKNATALRKAGYKFDDQGNIQPLDYSELTPDQQAMYDLRGAQQDAQEARAQLDRFKADPNSPAYKMAQQRLDVANRRLDLSTQEFLMHSRGVDADGNPLPGAMLEPNGTSVGTAFQENVRPTGTQRDAAGRAVTMDALSQRIEDGLKDPEIQKYMGPIGGRLAEEQARLGTLPAKIAQFKNDLVSYGAFQAGLHPVRGIGGLEYFDKVMGGLGQTPEQLQGKLASNRATSQSVQGVGTPRVATGGGTAPPAPAAGASHFGAHREITQ